MPGPSRRGESLGYLAVVRARVRDEISRLLPFKRATSLGASFAPRWLPPELGIEVAAEKPVVLDPVPATPMTPVLSCDLPRMLGIGGTRTRRGSATSISPARKTFPAGLRG